jgi:hypothetical protein
MPAAILPSPNTTAIKQNTLKRKAEEVLDDGYSFKKRRTGDKTGLSLSKSPEINPVSFKLSDNIVDGMALDKRYNIHDISLAKVS